MVMRPITMQSNKPKPPRPGQATMLPKPGVTPQMGMGAGMQPPKPPSNPYGLNYDTSQFKGRPTGGGGQIQLDPRESMPMGAPGGFQTQGPRQFGGTEQFGGPPAAAMMRIAGGPRGPGGPGGGPGGGGPGGGGPGGGGPGGTGPGKGGDPGGGGPGGQSMLPAFGYQGPMGFNPLEQQAMGLAAGQAAGQIPQQMMDPSQQFYQNMLGGGGWQGNIGVNPLEQMAQQQITSGVAGQPLQTMQPAQDLYGQIIGGQAGQAGQVGMNPMEQQLQAYTQQIAQQQAPMAMIQPGQEALTAMAGGAGGPQGQQFRQDVYGATQAQAQEELRQQQEQMATRFGHAGGYAGGMHERMQAQLAAQSGRDLSQTLAGLNLQGFEADQQRRLQASQALGGMANVPMQMQQQIMGGLGGVGEMMAGKELTNIGLEQQQLQNQMGAAAQLPGLAGAQRGIYGDILSGQMAGGQMLRGGEAMNRDLWQQEIQNRQQAAGGMTGMAGQTQALQSEQLRNLAGMGSMGSEREVMNRQMRDVAEQRAYQDWQRSRQETMMPFNMIMGLLGQQAQQPVVTQGQSAWGPILGTLGSLGSAAILASSREFKKDISEISEADEDAIFEKMKTTQLFKYRYKHESDDGVPHLGLIAEETPGEITLFDKQAIGIGEYISSLHAAMKVMSKKIEKLERGG